MFPRSIGDWMFRNSDSTEQSHLSVSKLNKKNSITPRDSFSESSTIRSCGCINTGNIKKFFIDLWRKITTWFWFISRNEKFDFSYLRKAPNSDCLEVCLLKDNNSTENTFCLGEAEFHPQLKEISFIDGWAFKKLPRVLQKIMKENNISFLSTQSFQYAKVLCDSGFYTDSLFSVEIPAKSRIDRHFVELIQLALARRKFLDKKQSKALDTIEEQIVMSFVSKGFKFKENLSEFFQDGIFFFRNFFPEIKLLAAAERLKQKENLSSVRLMIDEFKTEASLRKAVSMEQGPFSVKLPVASLCALAKDKNFDENMLQEVSFKNFWEFDTNILFYRKSFLQRLM